MVEEKEDVLEVAADLEEKAIAEHVKARQARFAKMGEGKSVRYKRRLERMQIARREYDYVRVRVIPRDEETRKNLDHPLNNVGFHESGSAEWPLDSFTERRLRDGDVTLEGHAEAAARAAKRATPPARTTRPTPPTPSSPPGTHS